MHQKKIGIKPSEQKVECEWELEEQQPSKRVAMTTGPTWSTAQSGSKQNLNNQMTNVHTSKNFITVTKWKRRSVLEPFCHNLYESAEQQSPSHLQQCMHNKTLFHLETNEVDASHNPIAQMEPATPFH